MNYGRIINQNSTFAIEKKLYAEYLRYRNYREHLP